MTNNNNWLDTETKSLLDPDYPNKIAPATLPEYSLILLESGNDDDRLIDAIKSINECNTDDAFKLLQSPTPLVVNNDLSLEKAIWGQFELICCDSISVFISAEITNDGNPSYLEYLYSRLKTSSEFELTRVSIRDVPKSNEGNRFLRQFFGPQHFNTITFPSNSIIHFKKARIMKHWAIKIGIDLDIIGK
jgi:hypothetical protein